MILGLPINSQETASSYLAIPEQANFIAHDVENLLTSGIFGSGQNIKETASAYYRGVGRLCADECDISTSSLEVAKSPQLESIRRTALDEALRNILGDNMSDAIQVLSQFQTLRVLHENDSVLDEDSSALDGNEPVFLNAWQGHPLAELLIRRFGESMATSSDGSHVVLEPISDNHELGRQKALHAMRTALPTLGPDILQGVPAIGLFRGQLFSGYCTTAPLHIFVNANFFDDTTKAAELLQHEALHQKLTDIGLARSLFRDGYNDAESATVEVPWGTSSDGTVRQFSADRSFAAFHVYTHQTLLYLGILLRCDGQLALQAPDQLLVSWARANRFAQGMSNSLVTDELGPDGVHLVRWLSEAVFKLGELSLSSGQQLKDAADYYSATRANNSPD